MPIEILAAFFLIDRRMAIVAAIIAGILLVIFAKHKSPKRCTRCQQVNREQAIFCAQCGTKLRTP